PRSWTRPPSDFLGVRNSGRPALLVKATKRCDRTITLVLQTQRQVAIKTGTSYSGVQIVPTTQKTIDTPSDHARRTGERRARIGGRSERVVRAVLAATTAELGRVGYAALRMEDVATTAGVNKTTVYRRWPTKADLVGAAMRGLGAPAQPAPDTGSLRGD